jgi:hypothetical protein
MCCDRACIPSACVALAVLPCASCLRSAVDAMVPASCQWQTILAFTARHISPILCANSILLHPLLLHVYSPRAAAACCQQLQQQQPSTSAAPPQAGSSQKWQQHSTLTQQQATKKRSCRGGCWRSRVSSSSRDSSRGRLGRRWLAGS